MTQINEIKTHVQFVISAIENGVPFNNETYMTMLKSIAKQLDQVSEFSVEWKDKPTKRKMKKHRRPGRMNTQNLLKKVMEKHQINQKQVAELLSISKPTVSTWATGRHEAKGKIRSSLEGLLKS